jgi:RimJ/RimL family protein N-acetyltransferase
MKENDRNQPGKIYVNDVEQPTAGLVCSRGGKYYLFGQEDDTDFNSELFRFLENSKHHSNFYDLYCSSNTWIELVKNPLHGNVVELSRTHYILREQTLANAGNYSKASEEFIVHRMNEQLFDRYTSEIDPSYALLWESANEYLNTTFGFCIMEEDKFQSICNTFYIGGEYIEQDIITLSDYRNKGLAYAVCQAFIEHAVEQELIPYWDCDSGNEASNKLATKLGLDRVGDLPILWWHESKDVIQRYLSKYGYNTNEA